MHDSKALQWTGMILQKLAMKENDQIDFGDSKTVHFIAIIEVDLNSFKILQRKEAL